MSKLWKQDVATKHNFNSGTERGEPGGRGNLVIRRGREGKEETSEKGGKNFWGMGRGGGRNFEKASWELNSLSRIFLKWETFRHWGSRIAEKVSFGSKTAEICPQTVQLQVPQSRIIEWPLLYTCKRQPCYTEHLQGFVESIVMQVQYSLPLYYVLCCIPSKIL